MITISVTNASQHPKYWRVRVSDPNGGADVERKMESEILDDIRTGLIEEGLYDDSDAGTA